MAANRVQRLEKRDTGCSGASGLIFLPPRHSLFCGSHGSRFWFQRRALEVPPCPRESLLALPPQQQDCSYCRRGRSRLVLTHP